MSFSISIGGVAEADAEKKLLADLKQFVEKYAEQISYAAWSGSATGAQVLKSSER
jgi:hypothetical protein